MELSFAGRYVFDASSSPLRRLRRHQQRVQRATSSMAEESGRAGEMACAVYKVVLTTGYTPLPFTRVCSSGCPAMLLFYVGQDAAYAFDARCARRAL